MFIKSYLLVNDRVHKLTEAPFALRCYCLTFSDPSEAVQSCLSSTQQEARDNVQNKSVKRSEKTERSQSFPDNFINLRHRLPSPERWRDAGKIIFSA